MTSREKIVEQCTRLMDQPNRIRNMAIAAHVDHGKCVPPSTRVTLASGERVAAEDLHQRIEDGGKVEVASFNRTTGEIESREPDYATKRDAESVLSVDTSDGRTVEVTPEHRFFVLTEDAKFDFIRADELSEGDTVVAARNVPLKSKSPKATLIRSLSENWSFYVFITDALDEELGGGRTRTDLYEMTDTFLTQGSFETGVSKQRYRLRDLVSIADELDISLSRVYDEIDTLNHRDTDQRGSKSSLEMTLPESAEHIFYLAGMFFGDGDTYKHLHNGSEELQETVRAHAEKLGFSISVDKSSERTDRIRLGGVTLQAIFEDAFEYPTENKSRSISVPTIVETAPKAETAAFLRGYFDADGTVEDNRCAVSVTSVSTEMLRDVQALLAQFDIGSVVRENADTLYISGRHALDGFVDEIGFTQTYKRQQAETLRENAVSADIDGLPISGDVLRTLREEAGLAQMDVDKGYDSYENNYVGLTKQSTAKFIQSFKEAGVDSPTLNRVERLTAFDTSFVSVEGIEQRDCDTVYDFGVKETENFIAEGLVVHNTTLSDHMLAGAGMIPETSAGDERNMDTEEDEQERGITIDAANVSMTHAYEDDEYLINLIDTPGHVDFGGDVTRAMRAVDGVLILVDAVEGVMPQTETVVRQAMREGVKPTLFINKVDRLITELQESPADVQERMQEIITEVNKLIRGLKPDHIDEDWQVSVEGGTVAFGSAYEGWALSLPAMQRTGLQFADIAELDKTDEGVEELKERIPAERIVLDMVINHFPSPADAQARRIDTVWSGDPSSEIGQQMQNVDPDGETVFMVTDIGVDDHSGEVATGRVFGGTLRGGQEVYINGAAGTHRINNVGIIMGDQRETVDEVPAGNIAAVTGLDKAIAGSTVSSVEMTPFESVDHISESVITKSIEPKNMGDLDALRGTLRQVSKEDPTIDVEYNEDTGQSLISGQGELHLEVVTKRIEDNQDIPIKTGDPIVIYREQPNGASSEREVRTSNGLNDFVMSIEPLPQDAIDAIKRGEATMNMPDLERRDVLQEAGVEKEVTQEIEDMIGTNIFADMSKGVQRLDEVMELVVEGVEEAIERGPLAGEPVEGTLIRLHDATIHEDPAHRGPAELKPAIRTLVHNALLDGDIRLREPMQDVRLDVPSEFMGDAMGELTSRRGEIGGTEQEAGQAVVNGSAPVAEMLGFSNDIRSATNGRASWNTENSGFQQVPSNLQRDVITQIRERKGMKTELDDRYDYL